MSDKSFSQAVQDLQNRITSNLQDSMNHMLRYHTTATAATLNIEDEKVRTVVTNELITDQLIALLTLMKKLHMINKEQHDEFTDYLLRALAAQHSDITNWNTPG
ncbi:hypothetical protein [Dictyobacter kobayashii]|uniref:Uncharacterized protein n=1 Tax=Dictyobacter kobayashii TaxID=2014872 RepID=A0A402ANS4_9CHLR|nr:hypothetical protein [Dictyobacter kobayashii]GCE20766.1 hypothetical protein KDK_45660 [Dictyobacter kobayashii]